MDQGWIKLHRQILDNEIFYNKPDKWFKIFIFILLRVNHKDNKGFKAGSCFMKYEWIMDNTGATKDQVKHCIASLKNDKMVHTLKATRGMTIFVLNWELYQGNEITEATQKARQVPDRSHTINKNDKNDKNISSIFSSNKYIEELESSNTKHLSIIGLFAKKRGSSFASADEGSAFIKRWARSASALSCYKLDQIGNVMKWLDDQEWLSMWGLDTVGKYIDKYKDYKQGGVKHDTRYPSADEILAKQYKLMEEDHGIEFVNRVKKERGDA